MSDDMSTLDGLVYEAVAHRSQDVAVLYDDGSDASSLTYGQLGEKARTVMSDDMSTLDGLVYEAVAHRSQDVAVLYDDGSDASSLTYGQLGEKARTLRDGLRCRGLKEEVLGVLISPSPLLPVVLTGIMSVPAAFLPLDTLAPKETLRNTFRRLNVTFVLVSDNLLKGFLSKFPDMPLRSEPIEGFELVLVWIGDRCDHRPWKHDIAYVITTSGSTGEPKIVKVPHSCILPNVTHIRSLYKITRDDVSILMSPLTFDPSVVEMFVALSVGAKLLIVPEVIKMIPQKLTSAILKHNVTIMQTTPSVLASLGTERLTSQILTDDNCLRVLALGGESCPPPATLHSWRSPGNRTTFINLYGITEVSSWASFYILTQDDLCGDKDEVPLGAPLDKTKFEVKDEAGHTLIDGEGQLFLGGADRVCVIGDETLPPADGLRPTGDRVLIHPERGLFYRGRMDRQIKRHGKRLNLDSLDKVLSQEPTVMYSASAVDSDGQLHLFVKSKFSEEANDELGKSCHDSIMSHVRQFVSQRLPPQYTPDMISIVPEIPFTRHGKVDRKQLLQRIKNQEKRGSLIVDVEELLKSSWKACLLHMRDAPIDDDSTWLASGGDSFTAVHFLNLLTDGLGSNPPSLLDLILSGTFLDILQFLKQNQGDKGTSQTDQSLEVPALKLKKDGEVGTGENTSHVPSTRALKRAFVGEPQISISALKRPHKSEEGTNPVSHEAPSCLADIMDCKQSVCTCEESFIAVGRCNRYVKCCRNYHGDSFASEHVETELRESGEGGIIKGSVIEEAVHGVRLELSQQWSVNTGKCIDASPLLLISHSHKLVFIGSHSHKFMAVSLETGVVLWEQILGDRIESSACVSACGQYVVVGCYDGTVNVLSVATGQIIWSFTTKGQVKCSPVVDKLSGMIFVGSHDQNLYALSIEERACRWQVDLGAGSVYSSPVVSARPHVVYYCTLGGTLAAIDIENGKLLWRRSVGKPIFSSPCLAPGGVAVGCVDGKVYTFSHQGEQVWTFQADGPVFSSPVLTGYCSDGVLFGCSGIKQGEKSLEKIVFGCHGNAIFCVKSNGQLLWKHETSSPVFSSAFMFRRILHSLLGNGESLEEPDYATIKRHSSSTTRDAKDITHEEAECDKEKIDSSLIRHPGTHFKDLVVCSVTDGRLLILDLADGQCVADYELPEEVFSSPVIYDSCIYIGCRDDNLYCLRLCEPLS